MMDISEVAKQSGLSTSALRYYEELGLISPNGRNGLRRQYCESVLEHLALINLGRMAGFTLQEIAEVFTPEGSLKINRKTLRRKIEDTNQAIKRFTNIRNMLIHVSECPASDHLECPKFRQLLRVASRYK